MAQKIKKCRLQKMILLVLSCFTFSLLVMHFTTTAKAGSPYYIKVNKQQNCVTIYEKDKDGKYTVPVKAMTCSTGPDTPLGTYNTLAKYRWKLLMGDVWGQYSTRIVKGILFHSVWYYKMDETTLSATQYNKLGTSASHGCIRLTVADVKWIYDNCPIGTTVEIYNDSNPGPLGKPETIKIPVNSGWDPTDPSKNNPYNKKNPEITGAESKSVKWGTKLDLVKGIKASASTGDDITGKLKVTGKVDSYKAGKYKVSYSVTDFLGKTTSKTITITVNQCTEKPELNGIKDHVINNTTKVDRKFALNGVTANLSTKKIAASSIKVSIKKESDGVYKINYSVKAENKLTAKATSFVYVDTKSPVIKGIYHKEITLKQLQAGADTIKNLALKGIKVSDDHSKIPTDQVKVSVKAKGDYAYIVTYKAEDSVGNIASETVQFTYFKDVRIEGVANHFNLPYGTEITKEYVKQGIEAINGNNEECTDLMKVTITNTDEGVYKVTYSIANEDGTKLSIVSFFTVKTESDGTKENSKEDSTAEQKETNPTSDNTESRDTTESRNK